MAAPVDYVTDWGARLLTRLQLQFKDDPSWQTWCTEVLGPQFQDLEDAAQTLLLFFAIDDVSGAQLDLIGRVVGQARAQADDPTYRLQLRARIAANASDGSPDAVYAVILALLGLSGPGNLVITPGAGAGSATISVGPASFTLRVIPVITNAQALSVPAFLADSIMAGVRAVFEWQEQADAATFMTANAAMLTVAATIANTSLTVDSTANLPHTGSLRLDPFLATAETVTYTVTSSTTVSCSALTQNHGVGAVAELTTDPGLGFGDTGNPATGGALAGAAQA